MQGLFCDLLFRRDLPAETYVLKLDVASLACNLDRLLLDIVPLTVLHVDVVNLSVILKTIE
jgi:hypothetical protein